MKKITLIKNSKLARYPRLMSLMEKLLFIPQAEKLLNHLPETNDLMVITKNILDQLNIKLEFDTQHLANLPQTGPVIVVANHPYGGIEAMALGYLFLQVRRDMKILANYILKDSTDLAPLLIGIDPFYKKNYSPITIKGLQEAQEWLENKGVLSIFPAGIVSHWHWRKRKVTDPKWQPTCVRLATQHHATILPIFFDGSNSWYFHLAGMISPLLRTLLLPQQFFAKQDHTLKIAIGKPIDFDELAKQGNQAQQLLYIRKKTDLLKYNINWHSPNIKPSSHSMIVPPVETNLLKNDLSQLNTSACIIDQGELCVYLAKGEDIPNILKELGRLREITFKQAGEGTDNVIDLDEFDPHYSHLFIWHKQEQKIIGAYRLGFTQEILPKYGSKGMYLHSIYDSLDELLSRIQPAIELGRSFIVPAYQKKPQPLLLLWKALGALLVKNPQYKYFTGLVSVSHSYQPLSRDLIVYFLQKYHAHSSIPKKFRPKNPYALPKQLPKLVHEMIKNISDFDNLDKLISHLENDNKGLPILLKQYHGLNASYLGFSIDPNFNDCLDCLILVDIPNKFPSKKLAFYLGKEGAASYLNYYKKM